MRMRSSVMPGFSESPSGTEGQPPASASAV
jgi:hypothetical protein